MDSGACTVALPEPGRKNGSCAPVPKAKVPRTDDNPERRATPWIDGGIRLAAVHELPLGTTILRMPGGGRLARIGKNWKTIGDATRVPAVPELRTDAVYLTPAA